MGAPEQTMLGPSVQTAKGSVVNMIKNMVNLLDDEYPNPLDALREIMQAAFVALANGKLGLNFSPAQAKKVYDELGQEFLQKSGEEQAEDFPDRSKINEKQPEMTKEL